MRTTEQQQRPPTRVRVRGQRASSIWANKRTKWPRASSRSRPSLRKVARFVWTAVYARISGALPGLGCHGLRQPGEVGLVRRLPAKARMGSPPIVEGQVSADRGPGLADRVVGPEIHLLVLDRSPEPLNEDVVPPGALAIHADGDAGLEEHAREVEAGER